MGQMPRSTERILVRSETDLISVLILLLLLLLLFFFLVGLLLHLQKSLRLSRFQFGMAFSRNILRVNTHRLTETDFRVDIVISRRRPQCNLTPKSAAAWWVYPQRLACAYAAASASSGSVEKLALPFPHILRNLNVQLHNYSLNGIYC